MFLKVLFLLTLLGATRCDEICCVCVPTGLCENGLLTDTGRLLIGDEKQIEESKRLVNVGFCNRNFLTCCKLSANTQCTVEVSPDQVVENVPGTPWAGALHDTNGNVIASATLLRDKFLVTSGHDARGMDPGSLQISMGDLSEDRAFHRYKRMAIKNIMYHPMFSQEDSSTFGAIIELEDQISNSQEFSPVFIEKHRKKINFRMCYLTGVQKGEQAGLQNTIAIKYMPKKSCKRAMGERSNGGRLIGCITTKYEEDLCQIAEGASVICELKGSSKYTLTGILTKNNACESTFTHSEVLAVQRDKWTRKSLRRAQRRSHKSNKKNRTLKMKNRKERKD